MTANKCVIGIDLGGTGIKAGVVTEQGNILRIWRIPTEADQGGQHVVERMVGLCRNILADLPDDLHKDQIKGIGIGSPGLFDQDTGTLVCGAVNIPGLNGTPLRSRFEDVFGLPTEVDNDANAFALAEATWGAGSEGRHMVAFTIGTGVGGGVVIDGKVFHGAWGFAGELGHITVEPAGELCNCGNRGCLEMYASANAIARHAQRELQQHPDSKLASLPLDQVTCQAVGEAALQGDQYAIRVVERAAHYMAIGVASAAIVLNPDRVVIGGGGAQLGTPFFEPLQRELLGRIYHQSVKAVKVLPARLGPEAGLTGAAGLVFANRQI